MKIFYFMLERALKLLIFINKIEKIYGIPIIKGSAKKKTVITIMS